MSVARASRRTGSHGHNAEGIHVQLLHVSDCPLVGELRGRLDRCLSARGLHVTVEEIEGPYPSPTLLVNDADVTRRPVAQGPSCRLDSPTEEQILAALTWAGGPLSPIDVGENDERCA